MIYNGHIQIVSIWKQLRKSSKMITAINPNTSAYVAHHSFHDNDIDPIPYDMEYFGCYTSSISVDHSKPSTTKKKKELVIPKEIRSYDFILTHGGTLVDPLQAMKMPHLFDCNGKVYKELLLDITNDIHLIAVDCRASS